MARRREQRQRLEARQARQRRLRLMAIAGAAAVIAVIVLIAVGSSLRGGDDGTTTHVAVQDGRRLGSASAPVVIIAWEDYQCPFCRDANRGALKQVEQDYIATGKAQLIYRNVAFIGQESNWAAEAAECALDQGKFWEYHDALFARQSGENRGVFTKAKLSTIAGELGLNLDTFNACLSSGQHTAAVAAETKEGAAAGVLSTPTFFIGKSKIEGAMPYSVFKDAIEKELAGKP